MKITKWNKFIHQKNLFFWRLKFWIAGEKPPKGIAPINLGQKNFLLRRIYFLLRKIFKK